jgi:DNA-binding XRE family transcriptional regulator
MSSAWRLAVKDPVAPTIEATRMELDGNRYVVLREAIFQRLCSMAGVRCSIPDVSEALVPALGMDRESLAKRLVRRRKVVGLTQAELARLAGIRPETLNRIERGRTTPDFATIRKLVIAMNEAETGKAGAGRSQEDQDEQ